MKRELNKKLSLRTTLIILGVLLLFIIGGIVGGIVGHKAYLNDQKAEIVNYGKTESENFHLRKDGTLAYIYDDEDVTVDIFDVVEVSKGATLHLIAVLDDEGNKLEDLSNELNVENDERYFLITEVVSNGGIVKNGYLIEVANEKYYPYDKGIEVILGDIKEYITIK